MDQRGERRRQGRTEQGILKPILGLGMAAVFGLVVGRTVDSTGRFAWMEPLDAGVDAAAAASTSSGPSWDLGDDLTMRFDLEDAAFPSFAGVKTFSCTFGGGVVFEWTNEGRPTAKREKGSWSYSMTVVDLSKRRGRIAGNAGGGEALVLYSGTHMTFVEQTGTGNRVTTTVFWTPTSHANEFAATMSRQMEIVTPLVSTYLGKCIATSGSTTPD